MPVFVANGDSDPMILPHYSHLLAGLIPQARVNPMTARSSPPTSPARRSPASASPRSPR
jgi:hypothetical protein